VAEIHFMKKKEPVPSARTLGASLLFQSFTEASNPWLFKKKLSQGLMFSNVTA
jgi:hypothetical protein